MAAFSEDFLRGDDFEVVLVIFYCYDHGADASEVIEKIDTDEKIITNAPCLLKFAAQPQQIINNSKKGWLLGYLRRCQKTAENLLKSPQKKEQ